MNCLEFRQLKLSDPYTTNAEATAHRDTCAACRQFEEDIRTLDKDVYRALSVAVPENLAAKILLNHSLQRRAKLPTRLYWLGAAAALFLVAVMFAATIYQRSPLTDKIVDHVAFEERFIDIGAPGSVSQAAIDKVLGALDSRLVANVDEVMFAKVCIIDSELVAHLIVRNRGEQYTLLVMPHSTIAARRFERAEWRGIVENSEAGPVVVVSGNSVGAEDLSNVLSAYVPNLKRISAAEGASEA